MTRNCEENTCRGSLGCSTSNQCTHRAPRSHKRKRSPYESQHRAQAMTRVDNMKRVARVLCTVAGSDGTHTDEQVFALESTFASRKFTPTLIDSVARMVKDAAMLRHEDIVPEIEKILKGNKFSKSNNQELVLDMLRIAAVANFPRAQCDAIYGVAEALGYDETEMKGIVELIEAEREALANVEAAPAQGGDTRDDHVRRTSLTPKAA